MVIFMRVDIAPPAFAARRLTPVAGRIGSGIERLAARQMHRLPQGLMEATYQVSNSTIVKAAHTRKINQPSVRRPPKAIMTTGHIM
jgi:hypothetical protein